MLASPAQPKYLFLSPYKPETSDSIEDSLEDSL